MTEQEMKQYPAFQYNKVVEFMQFVGQDVNLPENGFVPSTAKVGNFRIELIRSEIYDKNELLDSLLNDNAVKTLDGILDVLYVVYGAMATFGLGYTQDGFGEEASDDAFIGQAFVFEPENQAGKLPTIGDVYSYKARLDYEYSHLVDAVRADVDRSIDNALQSLVQMMYRIGKDMNFNITDSFLEVHASNLSKFCKNEIDAEATVLKYKSDGIETYIAQVGEYYIVRRKEDDKVLKGPDFFEPELEKYVS